MIIADGRELKVSGTFFDELCLLMIGFDRGQRVGDIDLIFTIYYLLLGKNLLIN